MRGIIQTCFRRNVSIGGRGRGSGRYSGRSPGTFSYTDRILSIRSNSADSQILLTVPCLCPIDIHVFSQNSCRVSRVIPTSHLGMLSPVPREQDDANRSCSGQSQMARGDAWRSTSHSEIPSETYLPCVLTVANQSSMVNHLIRVAENQPIHLRFIGSHYACFWSSLPTRHIETTGTFPRILMRT